MTTETFEEISIPVVNAGREVVFRGRVIASVSTRDPDKDRWAEAYVYETQGGNYVCHTIGCSNRKRESDLHAYKKVERLAPGEGLEEFFGQARLTEQVFAILDMEPELEIETID